MAKEQLARYRCDHCGVEVIADKTPRGWVRILSADKNQGMHHHSLPPLLWSAPRSAVQLPEDGYWCSAPCLVKHVEAAAERAIERAKANDY